MKIVFEGSEYSTTNLKELLNDYPDAKTLIKFITNWQNGASIFEFQTSGSTGTPKTIEVSRSQILTSVNATVKFLSLTSQQKVLLCLDPNFIASIMLTARCLVLGMDMVIQRPSSNPLNKLSQQVDLVSLVPFQIYKMIEDGSINKLNDIQNILIGGAPLSPKAFNLLSEFHSNIYITYGMTETVSHIALMAVKGKYADASYQLLPGIKVETNDEGCLRISGAVTNDQIVQTNDVVKIVNRYRFKWLGRKDFVINSGGIKIHPEQVERLIAEIVDPETSFIISWMQDEKLGAASILIIEGASFDDGIFQNVLAYIEESLSKYYCPKIYVTLDRFNRTTSGKILRDATRQSALKLI